MPTKLSKSSLFLRYGLTIVKDAVLPSTPARRKQSRDQHCALIQKLFTLDADENLYRQGKLISRPDEMTTRRRVCFGYLEWDYRIRFALGNGYLPDEIDHGDHNRSNNRLSNLDGVSHSQNCQNRRPMPRSEDNQHLARWVDQHGNRLRVRPPADENGRRLVLATFALSEVEEANAFAREQRRKLQGKHHNATPPNHRRPIAPPAKEA